MIDFDIVTNVYDVLNSLDRIPFKVASGVGDTIKDIKKRVPPTVSKCVRKVYNIKANEIIPNKKTKGGPVTQVKIRGYTLPTLRFIYTGRLLTPVHFGMNPMAAAANPSKPYRLTMKVMKNGSREKIGQHLATHTRNGPYSKKSGNILFPTGGKAEDNKFTHVPMQRVVPGWHPRGADAYKKFTSLSMPQMITNERVADDLQKELGDLSVKRLSHNLERYLFKSG